MSGDKIVVSYAAIQAAQRVWSGTVTSIEQVFGAVKPVGTEKLYAKSLDEALQAYQAMVTKVGFELHDQAKGIAGYLTQSEETYRYVDATALTRAVPYNPDQPSPTMVVGAYGAAPIPSLNPHGPTGTTAYGVPAGADGKGTPIAVDRATAEQQYNNLPTADKGTTGLQLNVTTGTNPVTGAATGEFAGHDGLPGTVPPGEVGNVMLGTPPTLGQNSGGTP